VQQPGLRHGLFGQRGRGVPRARAEEESFAVLGDAGGIDMGAQRFRQRVMAGRCCISE
jgi:hypothetical protein